jgi:hypothetical protein
VCIDYVVGRGHVVLHRLTLERQDLPVGEWDIIYDADGFGCAVDSESTCEPLVLEQFLARTLCSSPTDPLVVVEDRGKIKQRIWSLSGRMREAEDVVVLFKCSVLLGTHELRACLLEWPRQNSRFVFKSAWVYRLMRLSSFKNLPSKWFYKSRVSWVAWLSKLGFDGDHLQHSVRAIQEEGDEKPNFMDASGISTIGLVALLCRWGSATPTKG